VKTNSKGVSLTNNQGKQMANQMKITLTICGSGEIPKEVTAWVDAMAASREDPGNVGKGYDARQFKAEAQAAFMRFVCGRLAVQPTVYYPEGGDGPQLIEIAQNAAARLIGMGQLIDEGLDDIATLKDRIKTSSGTSCSNSAWVIALNIEACLRQARRIVDGLDDTPVTGRDLQATVDKAADAGQRLSDEINEH